MEELKAWSLRRLRALKLWNHVENLDFPSSNKLTFKYEEINTCYLLPGGRWLLMAVDGGLVCYYDLDSPDHIRRDLINIERRSQFRMYTYWIDTKKPHPPLHFVFTVTTAPSPIVIFQVDLISHGVEARLQARRVGNLYTREDGFRRSPYANDKFYIEQYKTSNLNACFLRLFRYIDGEPDNEAKPIVSIAHSVETGIRYLAFISTYHVVVASENILKIYEIICHDGSDIPPAMNVLYTIAVTSPDNILVFSPPFSLPHITRIVLFNGRDVKGISIPHDDPRHSTLIKLGDYRYNRERAVLGSRASLVVTHDGKADLIKYSWGDDESQVPFRIKTFSKDELGIPYHTRLYMGEEVGRMVFEELWIDNKKTDNKTFIVKDTVSANVDVISE